MIKMTQVIVQPSLGDAEAISIVKADATGFDGDSFEFTSPWEAAHFVRTFIAAVPAVRPAGSWTHQVVAMSDVQMNDLLDA